MYKKPIIYACAALALAVIPWKEANAKLELVAFQNGIEFQTFDTNSDGQISQSEFMAQTGSNMQEFGLIDRNRDSNLTESEVASYNKIGNDPDSNNTQSNTQGNTQGGNAGGNGMRGENPVVQ